MTYNPTYGGQFQGIQAVLNPESLQKRGFDVSRGASPPEKVICSFKGLSCIGMPPVPAGDRRDFFAAAVFENDDLNEVMKHKRCRTKFFPGQYVDSKWSSDFKDYSLILPITDPSKRLRFYVCAITTSHKEEEGRKTRDIALIGIGYSPSYFMDKCKVYGLTTLELKPVQDGDASIEPGKLDVAVKCCRITEGPSVPKDEEDSVLETFQATLQQGAGSKSSPSN